MTSGIAFAAPASPQRTLQPQLLQLELAEQIAEYMRSDVPPGRRKYKKTYRSNRGDIGMDKLVQMTPTHSWIYYRNIIPSRVQPSPMNSQIQTKTMTTRLQNDILSRVTQLRQDLEVVYGNQQHYGRFVLYVKNKE